MPLGKFLHLWLAAALAAAQGRAAPTTRAQSVAADDEPASQPAPAESAAAEQRDVRPEQPRGNYTPPKLEDGAPANAPAIS